VQVRFPRRWWDETSFFKEGLRRRLSAASTGCKEVHVELGLHRFHVGGREGRCKEVDVEPVQDR
jgi:hypothetical protein